MFPMLLGSLVVPAVALCTLWAALTWAARRWWADSPHVDVSLGFASYETDRWNISCYRMANPLETDRLCCCGCLRGRHAKRGLRLFYRAGALAGCVAVVVIPLLGLAHLASTLASSPSVEAAARSTGAVITPLVPGVNVPLARLPYLWVGILVAVAFHELGHAVALGCEGRSISGAGVFVAVCFPGAYVRIADEVREQLSPPAQLRVYCAGVWHNFVLCVAAYACIQMLLPGLCSTAYTCPGRTPLPPSSFSAAAAAATAPAVAQPHRPPEPAGLFVASIAAGSPLQPTLTLGGGALSSPPSPLPPFSPGARPSGAAADLGPGGSIGFSPGGPGGPGSPGGPGGGSTPFPAAAATYAQAGLWPNDQVVAVNGMPVRDIGSWYRQLSRLVIPLPSGSSTAPHGKKTSSSSTSSSTSSNGGNGGGNNGGNNGGGVWRKGSPASADGTGRSGNAYHNRSSSSPPQPSSSASSWTAGRRLPPYALARLARSARSPGLCVPQSQLGRLHGLLKRGGRGGGRGGGG
eukprot:g4637.t1